MDTWMDEMTISGSGVDGGDGVGDGGGDGGDSWG